MSNQEQHPIVAWGIRNGVIAGGFVGWDAHQIIQMNPLLASITGAVIGTIAGAIMGGFVADEDGKIHAFFGIMGGIVGGLLGFAAAARTQAELPVALFVSLVCFGLGTAIGRAINFGLRVVMIVGLLLFVAFGPGITGQTLRAALFH